MLSLHHGCKGAIEVFHLLRLSSKLSLCGDLVDLCPHPVSVPLVQHDLDLEVVRLLLLHLCDLSGVSFILFC